MAIPSLSWYHSFPWNWKFFALVSLELCVQLFSQSYPETSQIASEATGTPWRIKTSSPLVCSTAVFLCCHAMLLSRNHRLVVFLWTNKWEVLCTSFHCDFIKLWNNCRSFNSWHLLRSFFSHIAMVDIRKMAHHCHYTAKVLVIQTKCVMS